MTDRRLLEEIHGALVQGSPYAPSPARSWICDCAPARKVPHRVPKGEKCYVGVGYGDRSQPTAELQP